MSIEQYINKHFHQIKSKILAVTRNHLNTDDLINDCVLNLLEKGNDYCHKLLVDDKVQHYLIKMAYIQYNSSTSPFHLKYRSNKGKEHSFNEREEKHDLEDVKEEEIYDTEKLSDDIRIYIGKLPVYERIIADKHFVEGVSQREMSRMYNINRLHIGKDLKNIKNNIQMKFNKNNYKK